MIAGAVSTTCGRHPSSPVNSLRIACWSRVARSFRISRVMTAGPLLHFGSYVARWYVDGRVVASWLFLFSPEVDNHP